MNKLVKFCTFLMLIGAASCGESEVSMVYNETYCADHWQTGPSSTITEVEEAVAQYFSDQGISISDLSVTQDGQLELCNACTCTSDRRIHLTVDEDDQKVLEDLRFIVE